MSFGVDNLGVINQKDAPAIWESDVVDFPANFVKGRILIDTTFGGIYLDTTTTRVQIQAGGSGAINYSNGIETFGLTTPTTSNVGLGGSLVRNTNIDLSTGQLKFIGLITSTLFNPSGSIEDFNSSRKYYPATEANISAIVPDRILNFRDTITGDNFQVLCKKN